MATSNIMDTVALEAMVHSKEDKWTDEFAATVARRDFEAAEAYRTMQHDWRWRVADELYLAWVQQTFWEGTKIPRASLGAYLAFEQIESLLARVMGELFSDSQWFECAPHPGTSPMEARMAQYLMLSQANEMSFQENMRRAIKSGLIYGNGIVELGWVYDKKTQKRLQAFLKPDLMAITDPITGQQRQVPTGRVTRSIREVPYTEITNRPFIKYTTIS